MDTEYAVTAQDLVLAYGDRIALAASSFGLQAGGLAAVIGPNGSGKSTLLSAIAGLVAPASGRLEVLGVLPAQARRRIGFVLQSTRVNEALPVTVREVVEMGRYARLGLFGRFQREDRCAVQEALERLEIVDLAGQRLSELSGGQRQRVFVAQGLAQQARVLLLDEPLTGLDMVSRQRILEVVRAVRDAGATVVMTTHALDEASAADEVLLLAGRLVAAGPPDDVLTPEHLADAYGLPLARLPAGSPLLDDAHHRPAVVRGERHTGMTAPTETPRRD